MPVYKYKARNAMSVLVGGRREAADADELAAALWQDGQFWWSCRETAPDEKTVYKPKANELSEFSAELGTMLSSGITLVRAMHIFLQSDLKPKQRELYRRVYLDLQKGKSFSEALEAQNGAFPPLMINLFRSGEASGKMDQTAKKVGVHFQKDHKIRSKIKNAMIYPAILIVVGVLVFFGVFLFILPQFFESFRSLGVEMPGITKFMMAVSQGLIVHWDICLIAAIVLFLALSIFLQNPKVRTRLDAVKLKLPKIGGLMPDHLYSPLRAHAEYAVHQRPVHAPGAQRSGGYDREPVYHRAVRQGHRPGARRNTAVPGAWRGRRLCAEADVRHLDRGRSGTSGRDARPYGGQLRF